MVAMFSLDQDEIRSFRRGPQKHYLPQLTTNKSFGLVILEMKTLKVSANQKTEFAITLCLSSIVAFLILIMSSDTRPIGTKICSSGVCEVLI
jgi:hypothetical protein